MNDFPMLPRYDAIRLPEGDAALVMRDGKPVAQVPLPELDSRIVVAGPDRPMMVRRKDLPRLGAWKVTAENLEDVAAWCCGWASSHCVYLGGDMIAKPAEYVIQDGNDFFTLDEQTFQRYYEPVP